ncbi:MAG: hypothetical protein JO171_05355 [Paludibacterium sp.]|uniref:hypothetical protein n=1 Tax=Paludibacterium sp. TaxID=1917523 RepID=UPI0026006DE3|nr:hypothetical protein [Paludibacterium sp.]MBV8046555.1 hypothetical protein [Paludibacterium sp.]MBV8648250.1 hypothetical protein [Paludibacterium sp.]
METVLADPWHFPRPALAEAYLAMFDLKLTSARGLFARRRMGKTEFLCRDLLPAAAKQGYLVAYTNLWDNRAAPDSALVSALAMALKPQGVQALLAKFRAPVKRVRASASIPGGVEGGFEAELTSAAVEGVLALQDVLAQLDRQKQPLLLAIDEAQVLASAEHSDFSHALRSALDIRKDRIKVIFAGSSETTLRDMFARPLEPFYNWAALEPFPLLGAEFVSFTTELANSMARMPLSLDYAHRAFDELHRTPEFFKRFIERYMLYQMEGEAAALAHTKASVFSDGHFLKQWNNLLPADQAVLSLLVHGESDLYAAPAQAKLSSLLRQAVTKNTVSHALRRLQAANVVTRLALGEYRLEDETFAEWVRRR